MYVKFGQQLYWIYTEGKSLIMKLGTGYTNISTFLHLGYSLETEEHTHVTKTNTKTSQFLA